MGEGDKLCKYRAVAHHVPDRRERAMRLHRSNGPPPLGAGRQSCRTRHQHRRSKRLSNTAHRSPCGRPLANDDRACVFRDTAATAGLEASLYRFSLLAVSIKMDGAPVAAAAPASPPTPAPVTVPAAITAPGPTATTARAPAGPPPAPSPAPVEEPAPVSPPTATTGPEPAATPTPPGTPSPPAGPTPVPPPASAPEGATPGSGLLSRAITGIVLALIFAAGGALSSWRRCRIHQRAT